MNEPPFEIGDRIELVEMGTDPHTGKSDPDPVLPGAQGMVERVTRLWDERWQLGMKWDNGRTLSMVVPPDKAKKIS